MITMTEPLTKLIIIDNYHLQDNISHYNFKNLTKHLEDKNFILTQHMDDPYISIFKNSEIKPNEKSTHIHFGLSDIVQRVNFYISELK